MTRDEGLNLLKENIQNQSFDKLRIDPERKLKGQNLIKHSLMVEAIMRVLARRFNENEEKWGLAGLLHDIDYEETKNDSNQHSLIGAQMLEKLGVDKNICQAVKVHNEIHGILPETLMEKALFVADPLTGLIVASVLVLPASPSGGPSKNIADLKPESVEKRFKEKSFAKGANREIIKKCEEYLNLKLEEFIKIGLEAMQKSCYN